MTPSLKRIARAHGFKSKRVGSGWKWIREKDGAVLSYGMGRLCFYIGEEFAGTLPTPEEFITAKSKEVAK